MRPSFALQAASFVGAMLILVAYVGHQLRWMSPRRPFYNILNAAGSAILAYVAFHPFSVGFVMLETIWMIISVYAVYRNREQKA